MPSLSDVVSISYVYLTVHHLDSWIKRDQLDVTCFIISLFNAQHNSDVNTSILRRLRLIFWVISWVILLWFDVCWCYVVVWLRWCGIRMQAEALVDVLTSETCWALNKEIIKQVTSSWSLFIQLVFICFSPIVLLTANGHFLDCATMAFSERYEHICIFTELRVKKCGR